MTPATETKRREIMRNVKQTCTELAAKFEQLHHQVIKPVAQAKDAVTSTMDTVSDTVSSAKHVVETVGEQISRRPWTIMLGSIAAGLGAGLLLGNRATADAEASSAPMAHNGYAASIDAEAHKPSFLNQQIKKMADVAVGAGLAVVRDLVKEKMPTWAEAADSIACDLTEQLGAVPFTGPILKHSDPFPASVA